MNTTLSLRVGAGKVLRFRNMAGSAAFFLFALSSGACGPLYATCSGTSQSQYYSGAGQVQYGHVTCVTSPLDKEETHGGE